MVLYQHGRDYSIVINGQELMHSHRHESELELARLGCAHLTGNKTSSVLIGGLGMGYTLRQALDMLGPRAEVLVGELLVEVVDWNREFLGELNGQPLDDPRVQVATGDVVGLIASASRRFDAILLDIDNGPSAITDAGNSRLYGYEGILACRRALREQGCLAVWSAAPSKEFEQALLDSDFHLRRYRVPAHKGSKAKSCFIWVASKNKSLLPPGGGEPRLPPARTTRGDRGRSRAGR